MARIARDALYSREVPAIDVGHHLDHAARGSLCRSRVGDKIGLVRAGVGMTVRAIKTQRRGDDAHAREKIVHAEFFERAGRDVLKGFACLFVGSDAYLALRPRQNRKAGDNEDHLAPELHLNPPLEEIATKKHKIHKKLF